MKKLINKDQGFTLVELMVVVAIIGILSAVAIPNFKTYQAKSRQSDAKVQLAAMYTAQASAFVEYDAYLSCLDVIGYDPGATTILYTVGLNAQGNVNSPIAGMDGLNTECDNSANFQYAGARGVALTDADTFVTSLSAGAFSLGAAANILDGAGPSRFMINQDKLISNTHSGLVPAAAAP